jgi:RHS repeat-associated protein
VACHIGRPSFATTLAGTKVWSAVYLPFGGVHVTTGAPIDARFPGQWFQTEAGLYQNWMRDYDPTTGRYIEADPLGLVDGASVYGYAGGNPGRYTDPFGLFSLADASMSYNMTHSDGASASLNDVFDEWLRLERQDKSWLDQIPKCPCNLDDASPTDWSPRGQASQSYHPGGTWEIRSRQQTPSGAGNQCIYDAGGKLLTSIPTAGSADRHAPSPWNFYLSHVRHDVSTFSAAKRLGRIPEYYSVRPVVAESCCGDQ